MTDALKEIEIRARALSAEERAQLAESLLESLRDSPARDIAEEWEREIAERTAAYDRGELNLTSAADLFAEARQLLR